MDTGSIANIAFYKYASGSGRYAANIACMTMDNNSAIVHGIAHCVLAISVYLNIASVHKSTQVCSGCTVYGYLYISLKSCSYITVSVHIGYLERCTTFAYSLLYKLIKLLEMQSLCTYRYSFNFRLLSRSHLFPRRLYSQDLKLFSAQPNSS